MVVPSGGSRPSDKVGAGHPDPEIRGGPGLQKKIFLALRASVWSKNKKAPPPWGPSLDPPLVPLPPGDSFIAHQSILNKGLILHLSTKMITSVP